MTSRTCALCALIASGLALAVGCGRATEPAAAPEIRQVEEVERRATRLSTIGLAQALLHETDVLEGLGDRSAAIERAERVLTLELDAEDPLREPLRLDAHGRLAELELAGGALDRADAAIDRGLAEARGHTYFEARLHVVRGRVHEARAATLREAGDGAGAERELRAALEAHERSIAINEALLRGEEGGR
jgi:tetratricopeptide (TPR) repeat protein